MELNTKNHWDTIYNTKQSNEVSWTQDVPTVSLEFIRKLKILKDASIIDIGGGDSKLVDFLLKEGYSNISVLDISDAAILRAKNRLGKDSHKVKWIVTDILDFTPTEKYDVWHDRAAFHYLTENQEIENYIHTTTKAIAPDGILVMGTFSEQGPTKCSGIDIKQYSDSSLSELFENSFEKINCITVNHKTPFDTNQNLVFCSFRKN